jgi:hypothetical protein
MPMAATAAVPFPTPFRTQEPNAVARSARKPATYPGLYPSAEAIRGSAQQSLGRERRTRDFARGHSIDERGAHGTLPFLPRATSPLDRTSAARAPESSARITDADDSLSPMVRASLLAREQIRRYARCPRIKQTAVPGRPEQVRGLAEAAPQGLSLTRHHRE